MSARFRMPVAVVFMVALCVCGTAAPNGLGELRLQMTDTVRAALEATDTANSPVLDEAVQRAHALSAIQVDSAAAKPTLTFTFSKAPQYVAHVDAASARLTLDFVDTVQLPEMRTMRIDGANAALETETMLAALTPQFVTRTTVTLDRACSFDVIERANSLVIVLDPATAITGTLAKGLSVDAYAASTMHEAALRTDAALRDTHKSVSDRLTRADALMDQAKMAMITAELAGVAPEESSLEAAELTEGLRGELFNSADATREIALRYNHLNIERQARTHDGSLDQFLSAEREYETTLSSLLARLDHQVVTNELLAYRIEQHGAASHSQVDAVHAGMGMDALDTAFASLRVESYPTEVIDEGLAALDVAIESVSAAPVDLSLTNETRLAALSTKADTGAVLPKAPASRERSISASDALNTFEMPDRMSVLSSSSNALQQAADMGILVMAQQDTGLTDASGRPSTPIVERTPSEGPRRYRVPKSSNARPQFNLYNENVPADQDPLRQLVNIDFRDMELTNVVALLAQKGEINVIAGTEVVGTVTANLKNVPLGRAIEIVLRMNGLGVVEEAGVYRITSYEEAIASQRETKMVFLKNSQADEVKETLDEVLSGAINGNLISVSANAATNVIIVSGPRESVDQLEGVIAELDIAEPVVPTLTMPIKLNYSEPEELVPVVTGLLTEMGTVTADARSRHVIVTDIPVKVQEIEALIHSIDLPVKQVAIDAMVVDAQLDDDAETGVDWILKSVDGDPDVTSSTFESTTTDGTEVTTEGNLVPSLGTAMSFAPAGAASQLFFKVLGGDIDLSALIAAQVENKNAQLLANPAVTTVENQPAIIKIVQEYPYQERTETSEGGQISSTKFKEIGVILDVTPRVTHDNHIITSIDAKESTILGFNSSEVPIEANRQAQTTLRMADGQTIYIGGMRSYDERLSIRKTPFLGDIPVLNFLFTNKHSEQVHTELLIFLTCNVLPESIPDLTPYEKTRFDELGGKPHKVDGVRAVTESYIDPGEHRDPFYKWKRTK